MYSLPHNERNWLPYYAGSFMVTTTTLLGIRLYSRFRGRSGSLGLDDALIAIAWILAIVTIAMILLASSKFGFNKHIWDIDVSIVPETIKYSWLIAFFFLWSTCFTKISVLMFYRRLVAGTFSTTLKWALWSAIAFVLIYSIGLGIFMLNMCYPVEANWKQYDPTYTRSYHCQKQTILDGSSMLGGALSVITDFISVTLPAALLFNVKINRRQRLGLVVIFGLGYFTVIAGIIRTIYLAQMQKAADNDKTWIGFNTVVAGIAEGNIGIICACAPSLHHFFRRFFGVVTSMTGSRSTGQNPSFVTPSTGSRSNGEARSISRTPQMAGRWPEDRDDDMQTAETYEWHQKRQFLDSKSDSISRPTPAAVFSHAPSKFRSREQRLGEPQTFLHGATDDEEDYAGHYADRW